MTASKFAQTARAERRLHSVQALDPEPATESTDVPLLEVQGALHDVVDDVLLAVLQSIGEQPRGVVCDLSGAEADAAECERLAALGALPRDWPGVPLAICSGQTQVRNTLHRHPLSRHLVLRDTAAEALRIIRRRRPPTVVTERLAPHPTAARAARNTVTRALLDWQVPHRISNACLVATELVNAAIPTGRHLELSVALAAHRVRIAVRDGESDGPSGVGRAVVAGFSDASGTLPTADGGKLAWAVLAV